jgi:hypothetical protein
MKLAEIAIEKADKEETTNTARASLLAMPSCPAEALPSNLEAAKAIPM